MLRRLLWTLAVLVCAWIVCSLVLFVFPPAETGAPAHADAVVMLSGEHDRLPAAEALIRRGVAPVLALSSVQVTPRWAAARRLCRARRYDGVPVVCFLARPYSTRGEAETFSRLARARGWRSIVVVTNTYHVTRASMLFHRCFRGRISTVGAGSEWWALPLNWAEETSKLVYQLTVQRGC